MTAFPALQINKLIDRVMLPALATHSPVALLSSRINGFLGQIHTTGERMNAAVDNLKMLNKPEEGPLIFPRRPSTAQHS